MTRKREHNIIIGIAIFLCVAVLCIMGISTVAKKGSGGQADLLEQSIRRAAVTCYAVEGHYPSSFPYLKKNYGIRVDFDEYAVLYTVNGDNIMPDISVVQVGK